ncbi:serine/threonine protein kinase [Nonomuraea fuscirosea]|uniref:serine/threonine protein kinase n=1 Tax=Nonomuraea fuscirosea TaxID=1291556 RepID=UPI00371CBEE7
MTPHSPLVTGDPPRLGGRELLGRLGEGGQGVVYLAVAGDTRVAVKWLRGEQSDDSVSVARFLREAEVARRVAPFCTAAVLDTGVEQGRPYIVSEYVAGPSLQQMVLREGPRSGAALDRLAIGTATALAAIHRAGIVHRDFKPANVILGPDGPRVIDFGIARTVAATSTISATPMGTPAYMSPEQIAGDVTGPAADMFSWAGTMVYASCGRGPFGNHAMEQVISRVLSAPPDLGRLSGPLREVVLRCLSKNPAERPTAEQVIKGLLGRPVADSGLLASGAMLAAPSGGPEQQPASPGPAAGGDPGPERGEPAAGGSERGWWRSRAWPVAAGVTAVLVALGVWAAVAPPWAGQGAKQVAATRPAAATPQVTRSPAAGTPVKTTLPGGAITLYEHPSDPIALTAYEVFDKKADDDVDYARRSLRGASFERYADNWESLVSPDGRYLAGRQKDYTSRGYDSVLFNDRTMGSSFRVMTVRKPLISTIRSWSADSSRLLLNIDKKVEGDDGKDEWISLGFVVVDVAKAKADVVEVADESIRGSDFGWDATGTGVVIEYGDDDGLRLFDRSGRRVRDLPEVGSPASGTTDLFSPSGARFVTDCPESDGGDHCLWDTRTGAQVRAFTSDCDKVLGWYDESHLFCWEQDDNASFDEVRVVDFDGKLVRTLLQVPEKLDVTPLFTVRPTGS